MIHQIGMFNYALKEIGRRKRTYGLNILVIGLVVSLIICINSMSVAYSNASRLPFEAIHSSIIIQKNGNIPENTSGALLSCSLAPMHSDYPTQIRGIDGVTDVSSGLLLWVFDSDHFKRVLGVERNDSLGARIEQKIVSGTLPKTDSEALIERTYASQYNLDIGQHIEISGKEFTVSGIVETSGKDIVSSDVYVNLEAAQDIAYSSENLQKTETFEKNDVNIIFVGTEQTRTMDVAKRLNETLNAAAVQGGETPTGQVIGTYSIYTPASFESQISSLFMLTNELSFIISAVVLVGAALIIIKNMSHAILQRRKEIGIMKAVGFRNRDIQKEIGMEMLVQIAIGYAAGIIISFIVITALSWTTVSISIPWELNPYPHFLSSSPDLVQTVQSYPLPIAFQADYALISLAIVLILGSLAAIIVTRRINSLKAMEVLRYE